MQSNYKRIGDYIKRVSNKNKDNLYKTLLGININKYFMPSVANVIGTDLSKYKVVTPNQFACNRMHVGRDYRLPIALSKEGDPFIVSPAYDVFEIIKPDEILADYMMMWFSRAEFDRNTWFYTDTDVRGKLSWDSLCDMTLPVPSIEKQRAIVKEYKTVSNRIKLNEQVNQKLEATAQALYKHWFVDFEFPNEAGQPYKSSGGKMVYNDQLDKEIPKGWEVEELGALIESFSKKHDFLKEKLIFFNTSDILKGEFLHSNYSLVSKMPGQAKKRIRKNDILYSEIRPKNKRFALVRFESDDYVVSTKLMVLRRKKDELSIFRLYHLLTSDTFIDELQKSAEGRSGTFPQITFEEDLECKKIIIGKKNIEVKWNDFLNGYYNQWYSHKDENVILRNLQTLLLSKMASITDKAPTKAAIL